MTPHRPIINSLLDTDFYKFLMLQMIWKLHPTVKATFQLQNRTSILLGHGIDVDELRAQLDHARSLHFTEVELAWLKNHSFYGHKRLFSSEFIDALRYFRLPEYTLVPTHKGLHVEFRGLWAETTMWEIPCLAIYSELYSRSESRSFIAESKMWGEAQHRLHGKIERLSALVKDYRFKIADFGTRRRYSADWHFHTIDALRFGLPQNFIGTSNAKYAFETRVEPIGTNAHELPMVYAALANDEHELRLSPYNVMFDWSDLYDGNLRITLPDTYGTTNFLEQAPSWVANWSGARPDSKPPLEATQELIDWWTARGENPKDKLVILSDGMTVDSIEAVVRAYSDKTNISIGWGTNLTNDFEGLSGYTLPKLSLVCKVSDVNGRLAVKLSDVPGKHTGNAHAVDRYKQAFNYPESA